MKIVFNPRQNGTAMIVVITILAMLLLYVGANVRALDHLQREIKLVERRQIRRVQPASLKTNTAPVFLLPPIASPPSTNR
jgi:hypothetical protein